MNYFQLTMQILSAFLMVYFLLLMIRIFLSWLPTHSEGTMKFKHLIHKLTDPYMNRFQGIRWLRFGMFDFSPVLGLILLSFVLFITQQLSIGYIPSFYGILIWIIRMIWGLISFVITIFILIMIVRIVTLYTVKQKSEWMFRLDGFLFPKISRMLGYITKKTVTYPVALIICTLLLLIFRLAVSFLLNQYIYPLLSQL